MSGTGKQTKFEVKYTKLFINNEFVESDDAITLDVVNPATEEYLATVCRAGARDIEKAIAFARAAFDTGSAWRTLSHHERGALIFRFADLIAQHADALADLEAINNGKSRASAAIDVAMSVDCLKYYAGYANKIHGKTYPVTGDFVCYTTEEPVGVCAQIIPWNFPIMMAAWKWGPCLASGSVSILKPSEKTPLTALYLAALAKEAGFPPGVIQVLNGGGDVGAYLSRHKSIDKVAFTGSTAVGREIMKASPSSPIIKRVTLELGGKSANIVCHDAVLDEAVEAAVTASYCNMGQSCNAGSRTFVHEKLYDAFLKKVVERVKKIKVGDPFAKDTEHGAIIDRVQFERVLRYIETGKKEGARLLYGGERIGSKGFFIRPAVFADVTDDMTIAREEIFGPVMSILKFSDYNEVIARANATEYGLAAGVQTASIETYNLLAKQLKAGHVYINCYDYFDANTTFGGFKSSGVGRELGKEGLRAYLETKTNILRIKPLL